MNIYDILTHFDAVREHGDAFLARCPAHPDRSLLLEISEDSGRTILRCQAGCETEAVVAAAGLNIDDLVDTNHKPPVVRRRLQNPPERPENGSSVDTNSPETPPSDTAERHVEHGSLGDLSEPVEDGALADEDTGEPVVGEAVADGVVSSSLQNPQETPENLGSVGVDGQWQPFPTNLLPEPVRQYVLAASKAVGTDPAYLACGILPPIAAAIGNSAVIQLKLGWTEPAVLWGGLVGESGEVKSPVMDCATRFTKKLQAELQYATATENDGAEQPQLYCADITVEALAERLQNQPRGLIVLRDELSGWLGSFNRYNRGRADAAQWLSLYGARDLVVDRKTGRMRRVSVARAAVSILGPITPYGLHRALGDEHMENGLAARLLVTMPPRHKKHWSLETVDAQLVAAVESVFRNLYGSDVPLDERGQPQPVEMVLTPEATNEWARFYNQHAELQANAVGFRAAFLAKIECVAARLALIVHMLRLAARGENLRDHTAVDVESICAGVAMARWFAHEGERVHRILADSADRDERGLIEWISRHGGTVSPRELQQNIRRFKNDSEAVEAALNVLARKGLGRWDTTHPRTGRPGRVFRLGVAASA